MMSVIPTSRPWITPVRAAIAVALLSVLGSAALLAAGADADGAAVACVVAAAR